LAESLEDDVAGQQVTDVVDGLKTTGAELREEDVEVVRDGDQLKAQLSPVGEERVQNIADRQADESAERAVEQDLNEPFTNADVTVDNSGNVGVSEEVQNEATEQALAEQNPGVSEDDVTFQDGDPAVQQPQGPLGGGEVSQPDPLGGQANQSDPTGTRSPFGGPAAFEEETGLDQGEDFTVQRNDGNVTVNVTQRGARELQGQQEQEEGDALTPLVEDFEGVTGVDLPGNTSEAGQAREQRANDPAQETFGGESGGIEQTLRDAGEGFSDAAETVTDPLGDALAANPLVDMADPTPDGIDTRSFENATTPQTQEERNRAELFSGTGQGAAEIVNVPRLGATAIEVGEVVGEGINATAVGGGTEEDFEKFEQDVGGAAALKAVDATRAAQDSPYDTAGQVLGGAAGASGVLRAGRALGGSSGARAAGGLVQPGEEVLRALRRSDSDTSSIGGASTTQGDNGGTGLLSDVDAPNVDTEIGPNAAAGRVEINVNANLRRSLEDSISDVQTRGQASIDTVQDALNDIRDLPDRARTAARNANFNADAALSAARSRAGDTATAVRERAGDAAESVSAAPENARQRAAQGAQNAAVSAEANAVAASERMTDFAQRAELEAQRVQRDAELPSVPRGFVTEGEFSPLSDTTDRLQEVRQRGELAARRARRDFEPPSIPRGFVTEGELSPLSDTADRLQEARQRGELAARRAQRDFELPSLPRGYVTDGDGAVGEFIGDETTGRVRSTDAITERVADARDYVSNVGVRVDIGKPGRRTIDSSNLDVEGTPGVEFRGEFDTDSPAFSPDDSGQRPDLYQSDADNVGDGLLQLRRTESESRSNAPTRAESDINTRPETDRRSGFLDRASRFETDIGGLGESGQRPSINEPGISGRGSETATSSGRVLGQGFETDVAIGTAFESAFDTEFSQEQGVGMATAIGSLGQESGTETRTGFESRTKTRTEVETGSRIENRFERRFETSLGGEPGSDRREFPTATSSFESVEFENAVATPSEVLGVGPIGTTDDVQDRFDEDEFDVSGGLF
jgi:hypothetical protein